MKNVGKVFSAYAYKIYKIPKLSLRIFKSYGYTTIKVLKFSGKKFGGLLLIQHKKF